MNTPNSSFGSRVSRREFLVAGGAGAAATLVGAGIPSSASAIEQWDYETDVAVIGSGGAGSVAALTAKTNGADVLIVEKAPVLGGTTAKSGGAFWIANNYRLKERGIPDPKLPFVQYCASYSFPHLFDSTKKFRHLAPQLRHHPIFRLMHNIQFALELAI